MLLFKQFTGFAIVGLIASGLDYLIFCILLNLSVQPSIANLGAFSIASVIGLHFNTKIVFSKNYTTRLVGSYYLAQAAGLTSTSLLLYFLTDIYKPELTKLIAFIIVPIQTFILNKLIVFK